MKTAIVLAGFAVLGGVVCYQSYGLRKDVERLAAENTELRLRNAARARVQNFKTGKVDIYELAVTNASYDMGTPASLLRAMRQQEGGSVIWEMGHKGKTAAIAKAVPPDHWQYYEASRTANKALWRWALKHHRKEAIKALGKAYTAENHAARWSRNVEKLEGVNNATSSGD